MKLIERFKPRRVLPKKGTLSSPPESRFHEWEDWIDCEGSQGLTQGECEQLLIEWGYRQRHDDPRIWEQIDMTGVSWHRIVDDNFDVDSYNVALKE
jgi:hypothetical protein